MKTLLDESCRRELISRLALLRVDTPARWGKMDAARMVAHANDAMRMGLGQLTVKTQKLFVRHTPFKQLIVYVVPFPKGAPTARALIARAPGAFEDEVAAFGQLLDEFSRRDPDAPSPVHPAFGQLTRKQWGVLGYKHMHHHLRQFGA
ncbi:MAG: DUF1569 domain-containing protein [Gemmatimonadaceae bacterium]|nr:DUF1569 domain-containing protein [Gemmatimonadaceae bacterium]